MNFGGWFRSQPSTSPTITSPSTQPPDQDSLNPKPTSSTSPRSSSTVTLDPTTNPQQTQQPPNLIPTPVPTPWIESPAGRQPAYVPLLGADVIALLDPRHDDRILDLGCGTGGLTALLPVPVSRGGYGCESAVGVDSDPDAIMEAKKRVTMMSQTAAGKCAVEFVVWDALKLSTSPWSSPTTPFDQKFTAVFSNGLIHFIKSSPAAVVKGIRSVLRPGGRFVAEFGGHLNMATVHMALINALRRRGIDGASVSPWYFPTREEYKNLLESNGFHNILIWHFSRPKPLPSTGLMGLLDRIAGPFLDKLPRNVSRDDVKREIVAECEHVLKDSEGVVPDIEEDIIDAVTRLSSRYEHVFTSGGIGPTHDDLIRDHNLKTPTLPPPPPPTLSEPRLRMALLPTGPKASVTYPNKSYWVPLVTVNNNVHILPGVPRIFRALLDGYFEGMGVQGGFYRKQVGTGMVESEIAGVLTRVQKEVDEFGVKIGSYPKMKPLDGSDWKLRVCVSVVGKDKDLVEKIAGQIKNEVNGFEIDENELEKLKD
ncbi:hypothetical protein HDU76_006263 [Blyttiomyces sp. JEL0837]|nr:hypothetical protein HDU76_006263 [Blyttiomyces sp. JEL0837]